MSAGNASSMALPSPMATRASTIQCLEHKVECLRKIHEPGFGGTQIAHVEVNGGIGTARDSSRLPCGSQRRPGAVNQQAVQFTARRHKCYSIRASGLDCKVRTRRHVLYGA